MNNEHTKILQGEQKLNEIENEIEKFKQIFTKMKINKKKKKRKLVHNFVKSKVNQLSKDTLKVFIMAGSH